MSYGLPIVTTTIGAEGLGLQDGLNALIADKPEDFAMRAVELYRNEDMWNMISKNSFEWMKNNFTYDIAKEKLLNMFQDLDITE